MLISVCSSKTPNRPDWTAEHGPGKVGELVHDAFGVTLSVEGEGKQTGGLFAVFPVRPTRGIGPADLGSDLSDVALTSETGRVRVSSWSVVHVVLSCHPGQVAR